MPSRKGWLTPNAPIPSDTVCRRVLIPNDLQIIAAVNGALLELTKNYNWEQFGSASPEEIAAAMFAMYEEYVFEPCEAGECRRVYRIGLLGLIERSDDGGETWESASDEIPVPSPRPEVTEDEKLCLGAANAENVLHQVYVELLDAWATDSQTQFGIGVFLATFGLLVSAWLGAPVAIISALIGFELNAFGTLYGLGVELSTDEWTAETTDSVICHLSRFATIDAAGAIRFDYMAIRDNIDSLNASPAVKIWLFYVLWILGADALDAAGATTAIETYDCDNCEGDWEFMLTPENDRWGVFFPYSYWFDCNGTAIQGYVKGGEVAEVGGSLVWKATLTGATSGVKIAVDLNVPADTTVTNIRQIGANIPSTAVNRMVVNGATSCCVGGSCGLNLPQITGAFSNMTLQIEASVKMPNADNNPRITGLYFQGTGRNMFL